MTDTAFQKAVDFGWTAGAPNASNFDLVVPAGKRLTIRQVSGMASLAAGVRLVSVSLNTSVGPNNVGANLGRLFVIPTFAGRETDGAAAPDITLFSQEVFAFAEGPNAVEILAERTPSTVPAGQPQGNVQLTISGLLSDI